MVPQQDPVEEQSLRAPRLTDDCLTKNSVTYHQRAKLVSLAPC